MEYVASATADATGIYTLPFTRASDYLLLIGEESFAPLPFEDVKETAWYYDGVCYVVGHGLFEGLSETQFAPEQPMTRAMLVTVLHRLAGAPTPKGDEIPFVDIQGLTVWYGVPVLWASEQGIVEGNAQGQFCPQESITREQLATILYRYVQVQGNGAKPVDAQGLSAFVDVQEIQPYAREAMAWMVQQGLLQGTGEGKLLPQGNAQRGQVAVILQRYASLLGR